MTTTIKHHGLEFKFSDDDIVNLDDVIYKGDYNLYNVRGWLLHDHGFTVCVVFASSLQDALDIAVNEDKMDRFLISEDDLEDYKDEETGDYNVSYLGNAGEPFDIDSLGYVEFASPELSICKLYGEQVEAISAHLAQNQYHLDNITKLSDRVERIAILLYTRDIATHEAADSLSRIARDIRIEVQKASNL